MTHKQPLQPNPTIFGIGTIIGLALGLFIGWVLWPVEWEGATLRDLDISEKAEYIAAVADAFVIYDSPEAAANARRRLTPLEGNLANEFTDAIRYFRNSNQPELNIRISNIRQLANSLGILVPDLQSLPDSSQSQPASEALIATVPAESAQPADNLGNSPTTGSTADTATAVGSSNSWLRSLLWFLAVLLIVGGALFLLGASGLVNWQQWWSKWITWIGNMRSGNGTGTVDEFEEEDDYAEHDRVDYDEYDFVDEFDEPERGSMRGRRQQSYRESSPYATEPDRYSFDAEEDDEESADADEEFGTWHYPQEERRPAPTEEFDAFDMDEDDDAPGASAATTPHRDTQRTPQREPDSYWKRERPDPSQFPGQPVIREHTSQDSDTPEMFRAADMEEANAAATIPGYSVAYAGHRYADDDEIDRVGDDLHNEDEFEDEFDAEFDAEFDDNTQEEDLAEADEEDIADEHWRVPTIDSVLATPPALPAPTVEEQAVAHEDETAATPERPAESTRMRAAATAKTDDTAMEQSAPSRQRRQLPAEPAAFTERATTQPARRHAQAPQPHPQSAGPQAHGARARYKVIDQHILQYQLGIPEYDESKPIVDPATGKYVGEFGMGASVKNGFFQGNPEQVVALEVWLFDKTDEQSIGNKTRILLSEYAVDHKLDQALLKERRDNPRPFTAQRGVHFQLESQSLLLDCTIVDVEYIESGASKGMFQRIKVDMSVHQKG